MVKKQIDINSFDESHFELFSSDALNSIENLMIPPVIRFHLASAFDTKFISTTADIWEFFYSGKRIYLDFKCFDSNEKKILKFFLISFIQVNTPSALESKFNSFKYTIKHFKNNKLKLNFNNLKILLNDLAEKDKNDIYYHMKFLTKLLFLENFSGFNVDKEYELDFLNRPQSFNSNLYYQEYEDRIDYPIKTMIQQGFVIINDQITNQINSITNEELLNSAILGLVYVSGLRPVQLAKLAVSDLKRDTIRQIDNFCRYSILYLMQNKLDMYMKKLLLSYQRKLRILLLPISKDINFLKMINYSIWVSVQLVFVTTQSMNNYLISHQGNIKKQFYLVN